MLSVCREPMTISNSDKKQLYTCSLAGSGPPAYYGRCLNFATKIADGQWPIFYPVDQWVPQAMLFRRLNLCQGSR